MRSLAVLVVLVSFGLAAIGCEQPAAPLKAAPEKKMNSSEPAKGEMAPMKTEEPAPAAPEAKAEEKPAEVPRGRRNPRRRRNLQPRRRLPRGEPAVPEKPATSEKKPEQKPAK